MLPEIASQPSNEKQPIKIRKQPCAISKASIDRQPILPCRKIVNKRPLEMAGESDLYTFRLERSVLTLWESRFRAVVLGNILTASGLWTE